MSVEEIKRVLIEQKELVKEKFSLKLIKRDTPDLLSYLKIPNAVAILGVRRCGKSTLSLLSMKDKKFSYINFDDENLLGLEARDLRLVEQAIYEVYGNTEYLVFDEIHNVEGWEKFIARLRETRRVIINGSNSKTLSGELATSLTGRHTDYILTPFNFREYLEFIEFNINSETFYSTRRLAQLKSELQNYVEKGGFPEPLILGKEQTDMIYNDILYKDIIGRYKIKQLAKFRDFAKTLVSYYSNEVSLNNIAKTLKIDNKTADVWSSGLEEAYLIYFLPRYGEKIKERLTYSKKIYVIDHGIISRVAIKKKDMGRIIENIVAVKLLRDLQFKDLYYVKNDYEVDFFDEKNKRLIQVTYGEVKDREIRGLIKASEKVNARQLVIVSWDEERVERIEGKEIKITPLYRYLLS
ncbi:MAG: ATP-binding protein [Nitrososphaerota archaeon]